MKPWALLLSKLRRSDDARVSYAEVMAAGAEPALMVRERVLEYGTDDGYEPAGCEHGCTPNLEYDRRKKDGLVGVACPNEPACWPGGSGSPAPRSRVCGARRSSSSRSWRRTTGWSLSPPLCPSRSSPSGSCAAAGLNVAVVWLRAPKLGFEQLCRGLQATSASTGSSCSWRRGRRRRSPRRIGSSRSSSLDERAAAWTSSVLSRS
ncbi:MAG: hypothetical protein IPN32_18785 [Deltaproteobacteria bacterium]|nr:hypothetical protein [Deltaproteobacteria bacterium]